MQSRSKQLSDMVKGCLEVRKMSIVANVINRGRVEPDR